MKHLVKHLKHPPRAQACQKQQMSKAVLNGYSTESTLLGIATAKTMCDMSPVETEWAVLCWTLNAQNRSSCSQICCAVHLKHRTGSLLYTLVL